jgi:formyltetrahydrofolate deformylase
MKMLDPVIAAPELSDHVLTLSCPDRPGVVRSVAGFLFDRDCNIVESRQFDDRENDTFFMRVQFVPWGDGKIDLELLRREFGPLGESYGMSWRMVKAATRQRVLIMVSHEGHCLNDLLFRAASGALPIEVPAIVSNHPDMAVIADNYGVPYHHLPVTPETKPAAEAELLRLVEELEVDLVVLARYMQILSADACEVLEGRVINIHHSMLPSFKGARPYHQAHERGVKFIGATAHYVTAELDEGPIIEQKVARVDHSLTPEQVAALGRDTESLALAHAVAWHAQNRVMVDGIKTVVFR